MNLKYLVTGTGRSGTVFMARLLTSVGITCGHETFFDYRGIHGARRRLAGEEPLRLSTTSTSQFDVQKQRSLAVDWLTDLSGIVAESSYMAAPFLGNELLQNVLVIHAVRHPVRVIQSFCNHINYFQSETPSNVYETLIYSHLPELTGTMPQYDRAALYYVLWNRLIESYRPKLLFKVENNAGPLLQFLGVPVNTPYFEDNTVNTYRKLNVERFTCDKIQSATIKSELVNLGDEYGYHMDSDYLLI